MTSLLSLIWITSLFALFLGLVSPEKVVFWRAIPDRKRSDLLYYAACCVACLCLMFVFSEPKKSEKNEYGKSNVANTQSIDSSKVLFDSAIEMYQMGKMEIALELLDKSEKKGYDSNAIKSMRDVCQDRLEPPKDENENIPKKEAPKKQPKRKVIGYCTVCRDGTDSRSSGRGACSHHGGVSGKRAVYDDE